MRWMRQELLERRRRAEELRQANEDLRAQRSEWLKERKRAEVLAGRGHRGAPEPVELVRTHFTPILDETYGIFVYFPSKIALKQVLASRVMAT